MYQPLSIYFVTTLEIFALRHCGLINFLEVIRMETNELSLPSEKNNDGPRFMTIAELMKRTTLSRPTIYRHIKKGSIPAFRVGRRVLIDEAFLAQLKTQALCSNTEVKV